MCKIDVKEIRNMVGNSGKTYVGISKELGMSNNYLAAALCSGSMSDEVKDKLYLLLSADKNEVTDISADVNKQVGMFYRHGNEKQNRLRKSIAKENREVTPLEVEEMFQKFRGDVDEIELMEQFSNTKITAGGRTTMCIPVKCLHFVPWQRNTNIVKAKSMAYEFSDDTYNLMYDDIKVFLKDGLPYVIDGNHRALAHYYTCVEDQLKTRNTIHAVIIDATETECVNAFLMQDLSRTPMNAVGQWRAANRNQLEEFVALKEIAKECELDVVSDYDKQEHPKGTLVPSKYLLRAAKQKPELLKKALKLIIDLDWSASGYNPFQIDTVSAVMSLINNYEENNVIYYLQRFCRGPVYYEYTLSKCKGKTWKYEVLLHDCKIKLWEFNEMES